MKRILTALVVLPVLLYTVWSSIPYFFVVLATVAAILALNEFYGLWSRIGLTPYSVWGYAASLAIIACFAWDRTGWIGGVLAAAIIACLSHALSGVARMRDSVLSAAATILGVVYIGLLVGFIVGIRMVDPVLAPKLLTLFFALVMMTDTGAYCTGRALGKRKLAPAISPGKTVEGSVGGFASAVATGLLCRLIFFPELALSHAVVLGAGVGVLGQVGDLVESFFKRAADVKDSSRLFPGHGGMLDRLDSLLFCAPLLYFYSRFLTR